MPIQPEEKPPLRIKAVTLTMAGAPVFSADCWIDFLAFANTDPANDWGATAQDGNGEVLVPGTAMPKAALTLVPLPKGGLFFSNGLTLSAGADAKIVAWVRVRPT